MADWRLEMIQLPIGEPMPKDIFLLSEAAKVGEMSLGTLYTHLRRVKRNHPEVYQKVRKVRKAQPAVRHRNALDNARAHTRAWFRRVRRNERFLLLGYWR